MNQALIRSDLFRPACRPVRRSLPWTALAQRTLVLILCCLTGVAMAVSEPDYQVLKSDDRFELRDYAGFVIAETQVTGDFDSASRVGFRRVASYIFGSNRNTVGESEKISMTAPVTVEPAGPDRWRLHFVMPEDATRRGLPAPVDPSVIVRPVPRHRMASVRFGGFTTEASIEQWTRALEQWIAREGLTALGPPQVARYNDPFTLPWRRRNEILIPVADR